MRRPMRTILVLILFFAAVARSAEKPNIIFILSDDLAMGDVGCCWMAMPATWVLYGNGMFSIWNGKV